MDLVVQKRRLEEMYVTLKEEIEIKQEQLRTLATHLINDLNMLLHDLNDPASLPTSLKEHGVVQSLGNLVDTQAAELRAKRKILEQLQHVLDPD